MALRVLGSPGEIQHLLTMYVSGMSVAQICRNVHADPQTVKRRIILGGGKIRNQRECSLVAYQSGRRICWKQYDLSGRRFGMLRVIKKDGARSNGRKVMWLCDCDCGGRHRAETHSLTSGRTTNCGCVKLEKWKKRISLPFGLASKRAVFARYKKNAERKGQEFDLVFEEFIDLCSQSCSYCGDPPSNEQKSGYKNGDFIYVGLDRVDNSLGYTKDNVVPCCTLCNKGKREMSKENFLAWVKRISDYNHFTDGGA